MYRCRIKGRTQRNRFTIQHRRPCTIRPAQRSKANPATAPTPPQANYGTRSRNNTSPHYERDHNPNKARRIGEAAHPGPKEKNTPKTPNSAPTIEASRGRFDNHNTYPNKHTPNKRAEQFLVTECRFCFNFYTRLPNCICVLFQEHPRTHLPTAGRQSYSRHGAGTQLRSSASRQGTTNF